MNRLLALYIALVSARYGQQRHILRVSLGKAVSKISKKHACWVDKIDWIGTVTRSYGHFPFGETWYETTSDQVPTSKGQLSVHGAKPPLA